MTQCFRSAPVVFSPTAEAVRPTNAIMRGGSAVAAVFAAVRVFAFRLVATTAARALGLFAVVAAVISPVLRFLRVVFGSELGHSRPPKSFLPPDK